jgi:hypothetical protein
MMGKIAVHDFTVQRRGTYTNNTLCDVFHVKGCFGTVLLFDCGALCDCMSVRVLVLGPLVWLRLN